MTVLNIASKPIIPWIGGKRRLAKYILPLVPEHTCYVEPFCGAAAIFFLKQPSKSEVINDLNGDVVNLYRVIQNHLEEFIRQFRWALISREMFNWLQDTPVHVLTDIQRAARFYYLQKLCFGGKVTGQSFGTATTSAPKLNLLRIEEELSEAHLRLSKVFIENLNWLKVIEKYDRSHTLFYCDPPYWQTEGYGIDFSFQEYERIAHAAKNINGKMIVSVNDIPEMRHVFDGLNIRSVDINYTLSKVRKTSNKELIITNY